MISTLRMPEPTHFTLKESGEPIVSAWRYGRQFKLNRNTQARQLSLFFQTSAATQMTIPVEMDFSTIEPAMRSRAQRG